MKTRIYMKHDIHIMLKQTAADMGMSSKKLMVMAMREYLQKRVNKKQVYRPVTYQSGSVGETWHNFHIDLEAEDYEIFTDMRNVYKMSVSLIVALAVGWFINTLKKSIITKRMDNYPSLKPYYKMEIIFQRNSRHISIHHILPDIPGTPERGST